MEPEQDRMAYTNTTPMLPIEEWGAIVHPGRQDTPDCEHDWRIVFTIDEDRNGFYQARCTQCPTVAPPDVMNDYIDKLQAELAARDAKSCKTCRYSGDCVEQDLFGDRGCFTDEWQPQETT